MEVDKVKEPCISVLMAVHNGGDYLRPAVESILGQEFDDFEFLVVDDASTDKSGEILEHYARQDARLRLRHHEKNLGLTQCLESLMDEVRGIYVARMDADDISLPGRFQAQVERFSRDPELGVLGTWVRRVLEDGAPIEEVRYPDSHEWIARRLEIANCFQHGSMMFRHSCLQSLGRPLWRFRYAQDYDLYLRLLDSTRFGFVEEIYYVGRLHEANIATTLSSAVRKKNTEMKHQLRRLRKAGLPEYDWRSREIEILASEPDLRNFEQGRQLRDYSRALLELQRGNVEAARELLTISMKTPCLRTKSLSYLLVCRQPTFLRRLMLMALQTLRRIRYPEERYIRRCHARSSCEPLVVTKAST
jgi:glycosyltransferase involved in cell wall biosynthesis